MKLYYSKGACSLAVRILIHELGINSDYEAVNLKTKKTQTDQNYLNINPKGAVPALQKDDGTILTENLAIQIYLVEQHHDTKLLPAPKDPRRYRVLEWSNFISTDLHKGCGPLFSEAVPEDLKASIFRPDIKKKLQFVANALKDKPFLMGDEFTLPDAYLFVILSWMPHLKVDYSEYENLQQYFAQMKQHPSVASALAEERTAAAKLNNTH